MAHKVHLVNVDTSKLPVLKPKEAFALLALAKTGDENARQQFIYANLKLVLSIVHRFSNKRESSDDIFQVGIMGLVKAVDNFDVRFNVKFSTYAVPMIVGEIRRFLRDSSAVRVSRSLRDIAYQALQMRDKLSSGRDTEVTLDEIAAALSLPLCEVTTAMDAISEPVSLFEPFAAGGDKCTLVDFIASEKDDGNRMLDQIGLRDAINRLSCREQQIILLRYFEGKTQIEVSEEVGISQAQVSRLEKSALKVIERSL